MLPSVTLISRLREHGDDWDKMVTTRRYIMIDAGTLIGPDEPEQAGPRLLRTISITPVTDNW